MSDNQIPTHIKDQVNAAAKETVKRTDEARLSLGLDPVWTETGTELPPFIRTTMEHVVRDFAHCSHLQAIMPTTAFLGLGVLLCDSCGLIVTREADNPTPVLLAAYRDLINDLGPLSAAGPMDCDLCRVPQDLPIFTPFFYQIGFIRLFGEICDDCVAQLTESLPMTPGNQSSNADLHEMVRRVIDPTD